MSPFYLMPHMTLCCSSLSFIIHLHYRHLLILFMSMTVSRPRLHLVLPLPSFGLPYRPRMVHPSVFTLTFWLLIHGQNDCLPFLTIFLPPFDLYFPLLQHYTSLGLPSYCLDFVALFSFSRNGMVLYLLHPRWHARLLSTLY